MLEIILQDTTLRGYNIPRDDVGIMANLYSTHMNPKDFPEPDQFRPSRFIDQYMKLVKTERVIPFSFGLLCYFFILELKNIQVSMLRD